MGKFLMRKALLGLLALLAMSCADNADLGPTTSNEADAVTPGNGGTTNTNPELATLEGKVILDGTGAPQTCSGLGDPTCDARGPGWIKSCDPSDNLCKLYKTDEGCEYPLFGSGAVMCPFTTCADDEDCNATNPDGPGSVNLTPECVHTAQSDEQTTNGGQCIYAWNECLAMAGTPCAGTGWYIWDEMAGSWVCSAEPDMSMAQNELCDGVNNDCDGQTDEGFENLGMTCDGADPGDCADGTIVCAESGLATTCLEAGDGEVEWCNYEDDDCDGDIDEGFAATGVACDGDDSDLCEGGMMVCTGDSLGTMCNEVGPGITETCNGLDDDCDGSADEDFANLGMACDGDDSDLCVEGVYACAEGGMSTYCNDLTVGTVELCNGIDDDCDGTTNEGFETVGNACDGVDGDACAMGQVVCAGDGLSSLCNESGDGFVEICDGADNDCDSLTDEACDDDSDGYCDSMMPWTSDAACLSGDCDDEDDMINPGMEEQCSTAWDDNCDGDTEFLADGVTPACSSCANAMVIPCNTDVFIDMSTAPNASNSVSTYECWGKTGIKLLPATFDAPEAVVVPDAPPGTPFSATVVSSSHPSVFAALLFDSCEPIPGTNNVSAYHDPEALDGTCAAHSSKSVAGGIAGQHFVALDAQSAATVTVHITCPPLD